MKRREFCRLVAAAATVIAAPAAPAIGEEAQSPEQTASDAAQSPAFKAFDSPTQDYAQFCATPANERQFYAFADGRFTEEKLDEKTWVADDWGPPAVKVPSLPIPGGSWDGVPMDSPFHDNLAGEGPYKPTWDSLLQYEAPEWYRDAKFALWAHWSPQCVPEAGDWYVRGMYTEIDTKEIAVLDAFTAWMQLNGEAIYDTRPWKVYGEGPGKLDTAQFKGMSIKNLGVKDIRFTRNKANTVIFAFALGWPVGEFVVESLGTASSTQPGKIKDIQLLGTDDKPKWRQVADGLHVELPSGYYPAADYAAALKIFLT